MTINKRIEELRGQVESRCVFFTRGAEKAESEDYRSFARGSALAYEYILSELNYILEREEVTA